MAPDAIQGAALEKYHGSDARPIVERIALYFKKEGDTLF
jgi:hypothetical protein